MACKALWFLTVMYWAFESLAYEYHVKSYTHLQTLFSVSFYFTSSSQYLQRISVFFCRLNTRSCQRNRWLHISVSSCGSGWATQRNIPTWALQSWPRNCQRSTVLYLNTRRYDCYEMLRAFFLFALLVFMLVSSSCFISYFVSYIL